MNQQTLNSIPLLTEGPRGCGHRKAGGLYLVSEPGGLLPCDKLPLPLTVCPTCSAGVKHTRGWTWIDPSALFASKYGTCKYSGIPGKLLSCAGCPLGDAHDERKEVNAGTKAGLLWIGKQFYPTPTDYMREVRTMGYSRRLHAIPRGFEFGKTWIFLAHIECETLPCPCVADEPQPEAFCEICNGSGKVPQAGIFTAFRPQQAQYVVTGNESDLEIEELRLKGVLPVRVEAVERKTKGNPVVGGDPYEEPGSDEDNFDAHYHDGADDEEEEDES